MRPADEIEGVPTVICRVCGTHFTQGVIGSGQAEDCASYCHGARVHCCYGSRLDGDLYIIVKPHPDVPPEADPICDACIKLAVQQGYFKFLLNAFYEGELPEEIGPNDLFDTPQDHLAVAKVLLKLDPIDSVDHLLEGEDK